MKNMKNFENFTKEDFKNIEETYLVEAVSFWLIGKITDWEKEFEIVSKFSEPCKNVYACTTVFNEVMNGGINQLFFNFSAVYINLAYQVFKLLGLSRLSDALKGAIEIYNGNVEKLNTYDKNSAESFSESYELNLFESQDDIFGEEENHFYQALIKYIKENINSFGD